MTPEQIALLTAVIGLLKALTSWPGWLILLVLAMMFLGAPLGFLAWFWRGDVLAMRGLLTAYRDDTTRSFTQAERSMTEMRVMYENNVLLVRDRAEDHEQLAKLVADHHLLLTRITDVVARLDVSIRTNQFCPASRVEKQTVEVRQ
jgi:hypothetical protein